MTSPAIPPLRNPPPDERLRPALPALKATRRRLWLQRLALSFGPLVLVFKLSLAVALLGVLPALGPLLHSLVLLTLAGLLLAALVYGLRHFQVPTDAEVRRAVERASALPHRPLTALADRPLANTPLWQTHLAGLAERLKSAPFALPEWRRFTLPGAPALRWGTTFLLLVALAAGWGEWQSRLAAATTPEVSAVLPVARLEGWITPPEYTGLAPLPLPPEGGTLTIPAGSSLTLHLTGGWLPPSATLAGGELSGQRDGATTSWQTPITKEGALEVRQDLRTLGRWQLTLLTDLPPQIRLARDPAFNSKGILRLDFTAIDDLGLAAAAAEFTPLEISAEGDTTPLVEDLPLAQPSQRQATGRRFLDLTAHPWAGTDVLLILTVTDTKGQTARTKPALLHLPTRVFHSPISRALIELRRNLVKEGLNLRRLTAGALAALADTVEGGEQEDIVGVLGLRTAAARLQLNPAPDVLPSTEQLMWDLALHFEAGGSDEALAQLRQAQHDLDEALASGAGPEELAQRLMAYQQALQNYLNQLARQGTPQNAPADGPQQNLSGDDLQKLLQQLEQLMASGDRDAARKLLSDLQSLMENLQAGPPMDPATLEAMKELGEVEGAQRELQRQTQQQTEQAGPGHKLPRAEGEAGQSAEQALRERLGSAAGKLADKLKDAPPELGAAGEAMAEAGRLLGRQEGSAALEAQSEALRQLEAGRRRALQKLLSEAAGKSDPFGRPEGGGLNGFVAIPDEQAAARARAVLDELRRRAGDLTRPPAERDYLNRLLKQF